MLSTRAPLLARACLRDPVCESLSARAKAQLVRFPVRGSLRLCVCGETLVVGGAAGALRTACLSACYSRGCFADGSVLGSWLRLGMRAVACGQLWFGQI